jgi:hypothetical protein
MKKVFIILLIVSSRLVSAQIPCTVYCLGFEDTLCLSHLSIDTVTFPSNLWRIGLAHKQPFDSAASLSHVIITDTVHPYPVNNYSVFRISNQASMGDIFGCRLITGRYYSESDSIHDYGTMEFSADHGTTWIDLIHDTTYSSSIVWFSSKPVLTGHSNGWRNFEVILTDLGSVFNLQLGDPVLFRFAFSSDSVFDNLGGLMYDDLCFADFVEGISEIHFYNIKSKIFPNPSAARLTIEYENPASELFQLTIYDIHSKPVFTRDNITENRIVVDAQNFKPGIYIYKLTNLKAKKRCWGKFIVTR